MRMPFPKGRGVGLWPLPTPPCFCHIPLSHSSEGWTHFLFCGRPCPGSLAQKHLGPSPGVLDVAPASGLRPTCGWECGQGRTLPRAWRSLRLGPHLSLGPTSLSEASGSSSLSDSGRCAWALLSSAGCRAGVRPGWWPGCLVGPGRVLACQTRMNGNNSADEEAAAQRARYLPWSSSCTVTPPARVSPGLVTV